MNAFRIAAALLAAALFAACDKNPVQQRREWQLLDRILVARGEQRCREQRGGNSKSVLGPNHG